MGRTIEQMITDGMTAAEIHKEVERVTKEKEREKEMRAKQAAELHKKERAVARDRFIAAMGDYLIMEQLVSKEEYEEIKKDLPEVLNEFVANARQRIALAALFGGLFRE